MRCRYALIVSIYVDESVITAQKHRDRGCSADVSEAETNVRMFS